jgi:peptide deformylase
MDLAKEKDGEPKRPMFFVNPRLVWASDERVMCEEGCLSVPDLYEEVERPARVKVSFLDYFGKERQIDADGMLAVCLQHEMDHLEGTLFIDHLSRLKREMMLKKLVKARKAAEREAAE